MEFRGLSLSFSGGAFALEVGREDAHDHAVELRAALHFEFADGFHGLHGRRVRPVGDHVHVGVSDGDDARAERDVLTFEALGIPRTIEALVMMLYVLANAFAAAEAFDDLRTDD